MLFVMDRFTPRRNVAIMIHTRSVLSESPIHRKALLPLFALLLCTSAISIAAELGMAVQDHSMGSGVEVTHVVSGSVAAQAGLKAGDVILQLDKRAVTNAEQFAERVRNLPEGTSFTIRISRDGWEREVLLQPAAAAPPQPRKFGLLLKDHPPDQLPGYGAQIVAVTPFSGAARAELQPGDVVTQVDGRKVNDAGTVVLAMRDAARRDRPLNLTIARVGWQKDVVLTPGAKPADLSADEWAAADETTRLTVPQTAPIAAGGSSPRVQAEAPREPPARAAEIVLDEPTYKAYTADLDVAEAHYQKADWNGAERYYRSAIQRVPNDLAAWGRLAYVLLMQQKFAEAVSACNKSLALGPPQAATLVNLGYSHFNLGELAQAKAAYLSAMKLAPQWAEPYSGLGAVYITQQDWPQAEKYYRLALDRNPGNTADRRALDDVVRMQKRVSAGEPTPPVAGSSAESGSARVAGPAPERATPTPSPAAAADSRGAPRPAAATGRKAIVAVGDFQVKAASAAQFIGDGLREMLVTTLHGSGNYIVVERLDLQGLAAEQALSRSRMARPGAAIAESRMDVAEIMVYGAVTEFESEASGSGLQLGVPNVPFTLGRQTKTAHMAIDMRVVDVATGRLIAAQRITGEASSAQTSIGVTLSARGTSIPASLGAFKNTPMEQAIRECVQKATDYIASRTPQQYFRHE